jgi:hypothetical protein
MFLLVSADVVRLWTSALFMLVVGMGNAVNMTSQRLMIHDRVGASYGPTAMAVEPLLSGGASMIASFGAGVLVDFVGHAAMFGVLGALALGCVVLTLRVPRSAALMGRAGTSGGQAIRRPADGHRPRPRRGRPRHGALHGTRVVSRVHHR